MKSDFHNTFMSDEMQIESALRADKIKAIMNRDGLEAILVSSNVNIFYCSGRVFRGYVFFMPSAAKPLFFIIRPNTFEPSDSLIYIRKPEQIVDILAERGISIPARVGLELDSLTYNEEVRIAKALGNPEIANASSVLREARLTKTPFEIELMKVDGVHQAEAYRHIPALYRKDMTDVEFQIEIERVLRREGCLGYPRVAGQLMEINMGSLLCGDNADVPGPYDFAMGGGGVDPSLPGGADGSIMRNATAVMVDMNGSFNGYQTDMTRVWSIGRLPDIALKAHECSRKILRTLEEIALPGVEVAELYRRAEAIAAEEGLEEYFMGHRQKAGFIGHGVGIELNEQPPVTPRSKVRLQESMTLALEPKFVIPHVGAVGVENTYVVRHDGLECITIFPEEIQELI